MSEVWAAVKDKLFLPILSICQGKTQEFLKNLSSSEQLRPIFMSFLVLCPPPKKKKEKTKPLCDEIGLIPRPLTYLLFPLEQQLALKISFQFIFNPKAWVFSWSLAGSLFPQPKQKSTLSCSLFLLAAKRILGKQKYRVP